jgi:hypothetical protein
MALLRAERLEPFRTQRLERIKPPKILKERDFAMSPWLELLFNVIAFGGFIIIATWPRTADR